MNFLQVDKAANSQFDNKLPGHKHDNDMKPVKKFMDQTS